MVSAEQLQLIRDTWICVNPKAEHGVNIFYNLFQKFPDNFKHFPKFQGTDLENIRDLPACHVHALSITGMLDKTIDILDLEGGIAETERIWTELGESHKPRQLPKQAFLEARDVILDYLSCTLCLNDTQKEAYIALFDFAFEHFFAAQY